MVGKQLSETFEGGGVVPNDSSPPHAKRLGRLKNGNPSGDFSAAPRCGAHARRTGNPCKGPAMKNGRCRMHGGKSTGPRTAEGKERAKRGNLKHGGYTAEMKALMKASRALLNDEG